MAPLHAAVKCTSRARPDCEAASPESATERAMSEPADVLNETWSTHDDRPAVAFLLASLVSLPCQAKEAKIGEATVTLTTPTGQCELDPTQPGDARMLQVTGRAISESATRCWASTPTASS